MYRHIVLFRIHDGVARERVTGATESLRSLAVLPGVASWRIDHSLDTRKGLVLVEDATFADRSAFEAFRADPRHETVAQQMSEISDWWIGDYET
ncbi:Dabb family protein [Microbacterium thalli]|uniref:Dabb family protein n=1 Tax=Microbacterium thalli TaxID=3027921 RepID=UPI0023665D4D|nr:Dabb family protein [Microbacterium thalli]MDD7930669.1 Dabb family protein [Microbacterium thalli]